eukprot:NODE_12316_length_1232_cov_4.951131.p1 GENE.NODE_12316_length_1232_cov_4.951131~~NODE_12316_length_1232_cov_4.951131.p1  ORF type:complete len:305 (+),score=101.79 NODE_12316_length_1232_cov_4.951131:107-1021(+)
MSGRGKGEAGCKVYVNGLPYKTSWPSLKDHFSQVEGVQYAKVLLDDGPRGRGSWSRGSGLVEYATLEQAEAAIARFNNTEFEDRKIKVELWDESAPKHVSVWPDGGKQKGCKGYDAWGADAYAYLGYGWPPMWKAGGKQGGKGGKGFGGWFAMPGAWKGAPQLPPWKGAGAWKGGGGGEWKGGGGGESVWKGDGGGGGGKPSMLGIKGSPNTDANRFKDDPACKVFIGNLAYKTKWAPLKDYMSKAGTVVYSKIIEDKGFGKGFYSRGAGLVVYATPEEAKEAVETLNGTELDGRAIKVDAWNS